MKLKQMHTLAQQADELADALADALKTARKDRHATDTYRFEHAANAADRRAKRRREAITRACLKCLHADAYFVYARDAANAEANANTATNPTEAKRLRRRAREYRIRALTAASKYDAEHR